MLLRLLHLLAERPDATGDGALHEQKGVKTAFLIGPNYAAGKDMLAGVAFTFKGQVIGQEFTKWPDQLDFSVELSKARAAKPDAIFVFYPGAAGVQFLNQYAQSGLKGQIPLYTAFTIDETTLPRQGELAIGVPGAQQWVNDLPNEQNKKFVADYIKTPDRTAVVLRAIYDAPLINGGQRDRQARRQEALRKAMEKPTSSPCGNFKFATTVPIRTSTCRKPSRTRKARSCSRRSKPSSRTTRTASTTSAR